MRIELQTTARRLMKLLYALILLGIGFAPLAHARDFPKDSQRGSVEQFAHPEVTIGKKLYRLVPASKIYNEQNMIIMPAAMPGTAQVMYQLDFSDNIRQMWLLTPDEVANLGPPAKQ